jgi:SAM-dependent methyltransferase
MLRTLVKALTPDSLRWSARVLQETVNGLRWRASPYPRHCPICDYKGLFYPSGWPVRPEAKCPRCGSAERHRLFKLWIDRNAERLKNKRILHFAPERGLSPILRRCSSRYTTADLVNSADLKLNIEKLDLPDRSFDIVVCLHVLEHVDDSKALSEVGRILADEGIALIMVPVCEGLSTTYEVDYVSTERDRELHFGQFDHLRWFGSDVRERITSRGFLLEEFTANGELSVVHGLSLGETLFIARKQAFF